MAFKLDYPRHNQFRVVLLLLHNLTDTSNTAAGWYDGTRKITHNIYIQVQFIDALNQN